MTPRELKARMSAGKRVYGTMITSSSPRWPDQVAKLGFDFVFLDTEHTAVDRDRLSWMCLAYRGVGLPPIVRIPAPDPYLACMALDGGASGIIVPYTESVEQVRELCGAVKWRPLKGRKLADFLAGKAPLEPELARYLETANGNNLLVLNIESIPAIEVLDELVSVPGVDAVLIGPHDLSCSLGLPELYDRPEFDRAAKLIFTRARAKGVAAGIHAWMGLEREADWARAGANFIVHESDIRTFTHTIGRDLAQLRRMLGDSPAA